jgi:hypothetical protein
MDGDVLDIGNLTQDIMLGDRPCQLQVAVVNLPRRIGSGDELPSYLEGERRPPEVRCDGAICAWHGVHSPHFLAGGVACTPCYGRC